MIIIIVIIIMVIMIIIASEARKAVGLSRSYKKYYKKYIQGPRKLSPSHVRDNNITQRAGQQYHSTCGTTISLNVRTTSFLEVFFRR